MQNFVEFFCCRLMYPVPAVAFVLVFISSCLILDGRDFSAEIMLRRKEKGIYHTVAKRWDVPSDARMAVDQRHSIHMQGFLEDSTCLGLLGLRCFCVAENWRCPSKFLSNPDLVLMVNYRCRRWVFRNLLNHLSKALILLSILGLGYILAGWQVSLVSVTGQWQSSFGVTWFWDPNFLSLSAFDFIRSPQSDWQ